MTGQASHHPHDGTAAGKTHVWVQMIVRSLISVALIAGSVLVFVKVGSGLVPPRAKQDSGSTTAVEVLPIQEHTGGIDFDVDGVVIPFRQIEIPAEVGGRIAYKSDNCRIGHTVAKGEPLLRIDGEEYQLEVRQLEENVKQARANLGELDVEVAASKRQIELAEEDRSIKRREVDRYEKIDDPGVYSKSELDTARLKELQARDALQTEKDQLALLQARRSRLEAAADLGLAQLERAKLDLKRTEITSPINGVITREGPEQGGYIQKGGTITVVQDTSRMEIRCSIPMQQMNWLWQSKTGTSQPVAQQNVYQLPETPATVEFDLGNGRCLWQGTVAYLDGAQVDQQTRMVPCRVVVEDPRQVKFDGEAAETIKSAPLTLMTGMFVNVQIHARPDVALLRLPEIAVQPGGRVWTVRQASQSDAAVWQLHEESINVAHASDETVLFYAYGSRLKPGDQVVTSPLAAPTEGARVEIVESK